ncbi:MAG TPA: DUF4097 family beta strand repeat-containing protein [Gemmatimonadaceae bacterium]|nr:DUF4097 family beta strand repeat-containing protein [Gemmatimonadaceae bacterium]
MRSTVLRPLVTSAALAALLAAPAVSRAQAGERYTMRGSEIAIYNLVGSIKAVGGSGGDVVVTVTRGGKDASQLRVENGEIHGRASLRVIYPARRITFEGDRGGRYGWNGGRTTLRVDSDGTFGDNDEGQRVEITDRSGGLEARADLTVAVPAGRRIDLNLAAGEVSVTNVDGDIYVDVHAANVTTNGTKGVLSLDTGSGTVSVTDAQGDVTLDAGAGSVTLKQIRGDKLSVDAGAGRLRGDDIKVQSVGLDLGSGGATLMRLSARDVKLDSGSGSTELDLLTDIRLLDIDSGSGGVTIWIPATLGAKVDIDAGSGGIDVGVPINVTRWESDRVVGTIGDGQGTIRIDAGSGGIRIKKRP